MKLVSIVGARPQFIKAAIVSKAIAQYPSINEIIIHTGQHFDENMSDIFFRQMNIPKPSYNLNIHSLHHGAMTGRMIEKIEEILLSETPDAVMVYGDTNSTLAGALAAKKLHITTIHVEAGLRSFNIKMPEEINRILTDRISDILFCPSQVAVNNLNTEGFNKFNCKIINCGDVMYDASLYFSNYAQKPNLKIPAQFVLATLHRAENTDNTEKFLSILNGLNEISKQMPIILPLHPRTRAIINNLQTAVVSNKNIIFTEPVGYLEMLYLLKHCYCVMTDSGGLQKEAFFFNKPCITLREETEWIELVEHNVNFIAGTDSKHIINYFNNISTFSFAFNFFPYGKGNASQIIAQTLNIL